MNDLLLPAHSMEAEQAVLGGLLLSNPAWERIAGAISEADFYRHDHRRLFGEIVRQIEAGRAADVITVFEALQRKGEAEELGGLSYLNALAQGTPSAANIAHHAAIVRAHADRRALVAACETAIDAVRSGADLNESIDRAQSALLALTERGQAREPRHIGAILPDTVAAIDARCQGREGVRGVRTGIAALDDRLNSLRPGEVCIAAGRPGMGKTALALQVAHNVAVSREANGAVLFLSQEMEAAELAERALALAGGVSFEGIVRGKLEDADWPRMTEGIRTLHEGRLYIDDSPGLTLRDVRSKAMNVKRRHGLALVVIDYLQLMQGKAENRTQEIGAISRGIKRLAKELACPFLVLSQLSRKSDERPDKRAMLSDLRDSGEIEQDADCVLLLHRPVEFDPDFQPAELMEVNVAKKRNGKKGVVALAYQGELMRVGEFLGQWPVAAVGRKGGGFRRGLD